MRAGVVNISEMVAVDFVLAVTRRMVGMSGAMDDVGRKVSRQARCMEEGIDERAWYGGLRKK